MLTNAEYLRKAADEVRAGWCQFIRHQSGDAAVCALGAIENAVTGRRMSRSEPYTNATCAESRKDLLNVLAALLPPSRKSPTVRIASWNNAPGQTAENVAAAFELAAIMAEQEEAAQAEPARVLAHVQS